MTKKKTLQEAQQYIDSLYPNRFKLLTYVNYKTKCDFIWLETNDFDSICFFEFKRIDDPVNGRFPPSLRQREFNKRKLSFDQRQKIIFNTLNNQCELINFDPDTYNCTLKWHTNEISVHKWHTIISKDLKWPPSLHNVKVKETNVKKYGTNWPTQNRDIALKIAKKVNRPSIRYHWKTNEELVCQGSYEAKVVDYLNKNKIEYFWQSEVFSLSTGCTYRPDLYLIDQDVWVEIKGYMRKDAKEKWDEFHKIIHVNSELWNKEKLKELHIL